MKNKVVHWIVTAVLLIAAFVAGGYIGPKFLPGASTSARGGFPGGAGGPMGNLTAEEQAKVQNMSDSERRTYFQQKMGANGGAGAQGGPGRRGGDIEGEVLSVATDQITVKTAAGGSQNIYVDANTVYAYAKGVTEHQLAKGDKVVVIAQPETDGVMSATTIVIK